jgi:hypothetical protein
LSGVITTVGVLTFKSRQSGERTGCIDVCRDEAGSVHVRINRLGNEVVLHLPPATAMAAARLILKAAGCSPEILEAIKEAKP